jgi:hypothetical protein
MVLWEQRRSHSAVSATTFAVPSEAEELGVGSQLCAEGFQQLAQSFIRCAGTSATGGLAQWITTEPQRGESAVRT